MLKHMITHHLMSSDLK